MSEENKSGDTHPAIMAIREVCGKLPPQSLYDGIIASLGENPNLELLQACRTEWQARGYNGLNFTWALLWYPEGGPPSPSESDEPDEDSIEWIEIPKMAWESMTRNHESLLKNHTETIGELAKASAEADRYKSQVGQLKEQLSWMPVGYDLETLLSERKRDKEALASLEAERSKLYDTLQGKHAENQSEVESLKAKIEEKKQQLFTAEAEIFKLTDTLQTIYDIATDDPADPMVKSDVVYSVQRLKNLSQRATTSNALLKQDSDFRDETHEWLSKRLTMVLALTDGGPAPESLQGLADALLENVKQMAMREAVHGEAMLAMQFQLEAVTRDRDEWKQQHENLLAVRDQDLNNLERNAQMLEEESTMLRRELRALRQWQESGRGQFLEELRQAIERHEQTQATGQCGNLVQRFDSVLGRYRNKTTWALAKSQQFQNDVLIALRALGFLVQSAGYAHTHREKDALLRGVSMTLETAINKVRDFKWSFQDEWGGHDNEDIFRADFPVRHFIDQINQLRMKIRVLEGPSHRDETVTSDEEEFES